MQATGSPFVTGAVHPRPPTRWSSLAPPHAAGAGNAHSEGDNGWARATEQSNLECAAEQARGKARDKAQASRVQRACEQSKLDHTDQQARASEDHAALAADLVRQGMQFKRVPRHGQCWWWSVAVSLTGGSRRNDRGLPWGCGQGGGRALGSEQQ